MWKILLYSLLLIAGLITSQIVDLSHFQIPLFDIPIPLSDQVIPLNGYLIPLELVTTACLAYIMIEVGLEFTIDKNRLHDYGKDYLIAVTAASFPWIFCSLYFYYVIGTDVREALLIGRFAAPTSAGLLFAMLSAAGLATTWFFHKARILAIFDDLDTILLMIPLQIMFVGFTLEGLWLILIIFFLLWLGYHYLHMCKLPIRDGWLLVYGVFVDFFCYFTEKSFGIHLEVLLPAFVLGCLLYNPAQQKPEHAFLEPEGDKGTRFIDFIVKNGFMFLVGCSIPQMDFSEFNLTLVILNVMALTILSNLGKMFPTFCYKHEASFRERLALSVAMFPRGEVGAGVLLVAIGFSANAQAIKLAALSLTLNLLLTGIFIMIALWLIRPIYKPRL